jgi:hypothetical protein
LHAAVRVEAQERSRVEHLCRYIARPPFSNVRLSVSRSGEVVLALRTPFRDGTTHFVLRGGALSEGAPSTKIVSVRRPPEQALRGRLD